MGDDEDAPRYTTKRLKHEVAKAVGRALAERAGGVKAERDGMHRRAQLAEALYQSVVSTLKMWREVLGPDRRHDDFVLFSFALADIVDTANKNRARGLV